MTRMKVLAKDEHSSLFCPSLSDRAKRFIILPLEPNVIKLFTTIIYECLQQAEMFVVGKTLQSSLSFVSKVRAYRNETPFRCSTLRQPLALTSKH